MVRCAYVVRSHARRKTHAALSTVSGLAQITQQCKAKTAELAAQLQAGEQADPDFDVVNHEVSCLFMEEHGLYSSDPDPAGTFTKPCTFSLILPCRRSPCPAEMEGPLPNIRLFALQWRPRLRRSRWLWHQLVPRRRGSSVHPASRSRGPLSNRRYRRGGLRHQVSKGRGLGLHRGRQPHCRRRQGDPGILLPITI